jgi:hypothetical protein
MTRWYVDENAMVQWWKHNGTDVKQRLYDCETTIVRWRNNEGSMMKTWWYYGERRCYDGENTMVRYDETAMAWWWKRDIIFSIVSSHHRNFTIMSWCFNHRTISMNHRTIVHSCSGRQKCYLCQMEHRNRLILNDTISWLVLQLAEISRLASHLVRRRETRNSFQVIYR